MRKNFDVGAAIGYRAKNFMSVGKIFNERAKAHALHNSKDFYVEQVDSPFRADFLALNEFGAADFIRIAVDIEGG